jgi:hypothetical protein
MNVSPRLLTELGRFSTLALTCATLWLASVGCTGPSEEGRTPDPSTSEVTTVGGLEVNVVKMGATMQATVADATGSLVYDYEGPFVIDGINVVKFTLLSNGLTGYHEFSEATIPSPSYFAKAAYYDYMGTSRASLAEASYDLQGCDGFPASTSCTSVGSCCDTHDACYAQNNCSASSWLYTGMLDLISKCATCNSAVDACFAGGGSGPAACCATNTCKQAWGTPGRSGQCLCHGKPSPCNSAACTGKDGGVERGVGDGGVDGNHGSDATDEGNGGTCDNVEHSAPPP